MPPKSKDIPIYTEVDINSVYKPEEKSVFTNILKRYLKKDLNFGNKIKKGTLIYLLNYINTYNQDLRDSKDINESEKKYIIPPFVMNVNDRKLKKPTIQTWLIGNPSSSTVHDIDKLLMSSEEEEFIDEKEKERKKDKKELVKKFKNVSSNFVDFLFNETEFDREKFLEFAVDFKNSVFPGRNISDEEAYNIAIEMINERIKFR